MNGHGEKLSRKWEQAIAALLSQGTIAKAAQVAKINEATLRRWLKDPKFRDAYYGARADLLAQADASPGQWYDREDISAAAAREYARRLLRRRVLASGGDDPAA